MVIGGKVEVVGGWEIVVVGTPAPVVEMALQFGTIVAGLGPFWIGLQPGNSFRYAGDFGEVNLARVIEKIYAHPSTTSLTTGFCEQLLIVASLRTVSARQPSGRPPISVQVSIARWRESLSHPKT